MEDKKEKLFVYGTLKQSAVQKEVIGRTVKAEPDVLKGYKKSTIKINNNIYPILIEDQNSATQGFVLSITSLEMKKIDEYETSAYKRKRVILKSGEEAWIYCE